MVTIQFRIGSIVLGFVVVLSKMASNDPVCFIFFDKSPSCSFSALDTRFNVGVFVYVYVYVCVCDGARVPFSFLLSLANTMFCRYLTDILRYALRSTIISQFLLELFKKLPLKLLKIYNLFFFGFCFILS